MTRRNGQAALEYIVTYGWAFLLILVAFGALAYFGILNPSKWLPSKCDLGVQLECQDYQVLAGPPTKISLYVRNSFGKDIIIQDARVLLDDGTTLGSLAAFKLITAGNTTSIDLSGLNDLGISKGEKRQLTLQIQFTRSGSGSPSHWLTGSLYATAQ